MKLIFSIFIFAMVGVTCAQPVLQKPFKLELGEEVHTRKLNFNGNDFSIEKYVGNYIWDFSDYSILPELYSEIATDNILPPFTQNYTYVWDKSISNNRRFLVTNTEVKWVSESSDFKTFQPAFNYTKIPLFYGESSQLQVTNVFYSGVQYDPRFEAANFAYCGNGNVILPNGILVENVGLHFFNYVWDLSRNGRSMEYNFFRENDSYPFLRVYSTIQSYDSPEYFINAELIDEFSQFLSVNDAHPKNHFKIYPNPVAESFFIEGVELGTIEIWDTQGKLIQSENITQNQQSINVSNLKSGVYFVKIKKNQFIQTLKLVKN